MFLLKLRVFSVRSVRKRYVNPIAFAYGFAPHMLKYCLMHTLHLGLLHFLNGASLTLLSEHGWFGRELDTKLLLEILTVRFRKWCSVQGIRPCAFPSMFSRKNVLWKHLPHKQPWKAFAGLHHHRPVSSETWGILRTAFKSLEQQNYDCIFDNVSECVGCFDATWKQITWACPDNWNHELNFPVGAAARGCWQIPFRSGCKLVLGRGEPVSWLTHVCFNARFVDVILSPISSMDGWCEVFGALQICRASFSWTTTNDTLPPPSSKDPRNFFLLRTLSVVMCLVMTFDFSLSLNTLLFQLRHTRKFASKCGQRKSTHEPTMHISMKMPWEPSRQFVKEHAGHSWRSVWWAEFCWASKSLAAMLVCSRTKNAALVSPWGVAGWFVDKQGQENSLIWSIYKLLAFIYYQYHPKVGKYFPHGQHRKSDSKIGFRMLLWEATLAKSEAM